MTSHGTRNGFFIKDEPSNMSPKAFASMLNATCGERPTVVLLSACYSGVFSTEKTLSTKNRIVLTAASANRTSFGCGAENQYTFWDDCLINALPKNSNWKNLAVEIKQCITRKESDGSFTSSQPQSIFGDLVNDLLLPKPSSV